MFYFTFRELLIAFTIGGVGFLAGLWVGVQFTCLTWRAKAQTGWRLEWRGRYYAVEDVTDKPIPWLSRLR